MLFRLYSEKLTEKTMKNRILTSVWAKLDKYPNGVAITHNLNENFTDLQCMYCFAPRLPK